MRDVKMTKGFEVWAHEDAECKSETSEDNMWRHQQYFETLEGAKDYIRKKLDNPALQEVPRTLLSWRIYQATMACGQINIKRDVTLTIEEVGGQWEL